MIHLVPICRNEMIVLSLHCGLEAHAFEEVVEKL